MLREAPRSLEGLDNVLAPLFQRVEISFQHTEAFLKQGLSTQPVSLVLWERIRILGLKKGDGGALAIETIVKLLDFLFKEI